MRRAFQLMMAIAAACVAGCGDDTAKTSPTTSPANASSAATMPAAATQSDSGAQATGGVIELPTTGPTR